MTTITPRDLRFGLDSKRIATWNADDAARTAFFNALSLLFPEGERLFIEAVSHFRDRVADPAQRAAVKGFITQEALHTREHIGYNDLMSPLADVKQLDRQLARFIDVHRKIVPRRWLLAATICLEHYTAILAREILADSVSYLGATSPDYARLWTWHALEECEHKSVAFDTYVAAVPAFERYPLRVAAMFYITVAFWTWVLKNTLTLLQGQGLVRSLRTWLSLARFLFIKPGFIRRLALPYLRFYLPGFHPSDIDDRLEMARARESVAAWA